MSATYPQRESKTLEFKAKIPNFTALIKTCVAFANGIGGKIIIGIDDKTHQILGIDDAIRDRIYDEFPNSLYDSTSPGLLAEIYEKRFNDVNVIIIEICYSNKKPVFIKQEGIPKGVYLRAGSNTRRASQDDVEELMRENKRMHFDEEILQTDTNILSKELLNTIFQNIVTTDQLLNEKIIGRISSHTKKYFPTVTGILALNENPEIYLPEAVVLCTRFHGVDGRDIIQTEEIRGCLVKQIEASFQLVKSWLLRDYQLFGAKLQGKLIIPEIALREAIINALLHRKYSIPGAVKIALYDNRLEIFSPGNFPGLFNINHLGDGTTYLRNPNLVRIARRFGIAEKLGTGIKLILESCQKQGIKRPEFIEGTDSVKVVFSFLPETREFSSDEEKLLALIKMRKEIKPKEVEHYLQVSRNTATRKLNQLLKTGQIFRQGQGPNVKYKININC